MLACAHQVQMDCILSKEASCLISARPPKKFIYKWSAAWACVRAFLFVPSFPLSIPAADTHH